MVELLESNYWPRVADYFPAAKISEGTKAEWLGEWAKIYKAVGPERFMIALNQVKHSVTDEEGNITPRKAYQFPSPAEIRAAVPPMYVERESRPRGQVYCDKCQDTHFVVKAFEEETPGFGVKIVNRATRCECWEGYRQSRMSTKEIA